MAREPHIERRRASELLGVCARAGATAPDVWRKFVNLIMHAARKHASAKLKRASTQARTSQRYRVHGGGGVGG